MIRMEIACYGFRIEDMKVDVENGVVRIHGINNVTLVLFYDDIEVLKAVLEDALEQIRKQEVKA